MKLIIHRDLKPDNLFLTKDGRVKILDFGLAKWIITPTEKQSNLETIPDGTSPGMILGTVGYLSPEQVKGQPADHRSDIFSYGIILYEMISGGTKVVLQTGELRFWKRLGPSDPAGVDAIDFLTLAPNVQAYAYSYRRLLSDLYLRKGLN